MKRMPSLMSTAVLIPVVACLALAGCAAGPNAGTPPGPSSADVPTATSEELYPLAKEEGSLTWYTSNTRPQAEKILSAFKETYPGVEVNMFQAGGSQVISKVEAELMSGKLSADFIDYTEASVAVDQAERDVFAPYHPEGFNTVMPGMIDEEGMYFSPYYVTALLSYNTEKVQADNAPTSWKDLTGPEWVGKVGFASPDYAGTAMGILGAFDQNFGQDYVKAIGSTDWQILSSFGDVQNAVISGQAPVAVNMSFRSIAAENAGEPVRTVIPSEGEIILPISGGVSVSSQHPNAARLFANFLLTADVQKMFVETGLYSVRTDLPAPKGLKIPRNAMTPDSAALADPSYVADLKSQFRTATSG